MAADGSPYSRDHLIVSDFATSRHYGSPNQHRPRLPPRDRQAHAARLLKQLAAAQSINASRNVQPIAGFAPTDAAALLEVESAPRTELPRLERRGEADVRIGAVRVLENGAERAALILPPQSSSMLQTAIEQYRDEDTDKGAPRRHALVAPLEDIRPGWIESLWTDPRPLPAPDEQIWWELWCFPDRTELLYRAVAQLRSARISELRLHFPELTVAFAHATRTQIERVLATINTISELRRASDRPNFYTHTARHEQRPWVDQLGGQVEVATGDVPYVCLLDSGVNRAHPLLEPSLATADMHTHDPAWGTADDHDHGTRMAGLALYGDLIYPLGSTAPVHLSHRLESVKILPPPGATRTDPESYGVVTQAAIALAEIEAPHRHRTFSLSVTNEDLSGERPTSWSSALDQSAAGVALGDEDAAPRATRLIVVAAGNIPDSATVDDLQDPDEYPIEDPAQAWNAITVGGCSDKTELDPTDDLDGWSTYAGPGERSPYSRASTDWRHGRTPIKPEVVFEAGNRALSPEGTELLSGVDSLSLLSTGSDHQALLDTFWATSAATALAARHAAVIQSRYPRYWPETVRALMIHSAQWSPAMLAELESTPKSERRIRLRRYGYGIPSAERALASAQSDLALVAQNVLRPFKKDTGKAPSFSEAHFYELPWPVGALEDLGGTRVELKITLSYFVEPSPGQLAPVAPHRYRSVGLRFAVKRPGELVEDFSRRVNRLDRVDNRAPRSEEDANWLLGPTAISAGSLHCDRWVGPAIDLADRRHIAVYPVIGWWRERQHLRAYDREVRYALVMSIRSPDADVDLYSEVAAAIPTPVTIDV